MSKRVIATVAVGLAVVLGGVVFAVSGGDDDGRKAAIGGAGDVTISDASVVEGNAGTKVLEFKVKCNCADSQVIRYRTVAGTATAASDFVAQSVGHIATRPGYSHIPDYIRVTINGDTAPEQHETFTVVLEPHFEVTITRGTATGTITDDDGGASSTPAPAAAPTLSIADRYVAEGNSGTTQANFTITRSGDRTGTSTVMWQTADDTGVGLATAGNDYTAQTPFKVTFNPGDTTKTASVALRGDTVPEGDERYLVKLSSPTGATIAGGVASGRIANDDKAFRVYDTAAREYPNSNDDMKSPVSRVGPTTERAHVYLTTVDGTARGGSDYAPRKSYKVEFDEGVYGVDVRVDLLIDERREGNEAFEVVLSNPSGGTIFPGRGEAIGTIVDDDD